MPPRRSDKPLLTRYPANPVLTAADWPYAASTVFDPAATRLADGTTLLLCRVENRKGHSQLTAARSRNGQDDWEVDAEPTLAPDPDNQPEENWGLEDPRITYLPELARYAVAYTAYGEVGPVVALAPTSCSPAARQRATTVIPCACIMALPIPVSPWRRAASEN